MDLRQLEYFVAVAEERNFTRAAARVNISQSGVSAQIRQLERELGQTLIDRSSRVVGLTEVGAALLPHARAALDAVDDARQAVDELAGLVRGRVTVGMVSGCSLPVLAELLAEFHLRHPGVAIALNEGPSDALLRSLLSGATDLALIGAAGKRPAGVEGSVLVDDPLVAVVGGSSPVLGRKSLALSALAEQPLVCLPKGTGARAALDLACAGAGFEPHVVLEASALPMVVELAGLGLGTGIVPASVAELARPDASVLAITRPQVRSRLELVWSAEGATHPAGRALVEHTRRFLGET